MSEYTLKFEAKFADSDAELIAEIAAILMKARSEILRAENKVIRVGISVINTERDSESRWAAEYSQKVTAQYERATKAENANATLRADVIELREALRSLYGAYEEARADGDRYFGTWDGEDTIGRLLSDPPDQAELKAKGGEA